MLKEPSGSSIRKSSRVPAGRAGVVTVSRVGPTNETSEAAVPPMETVEPNAKPSPAIVTGGPPAGGLRAPKRRAV